MARCSTNTWAAFRASSLRAFKTSRRSCRAWSLPEAGRRATGLAAISEGSEARRSRKLPPGHCGSHRCNCLTSTGANRHAALPPREMSTGLLSLAVPLHDHYLTQYNTHPFCSLATAPQRPSAKPHAPHLHSPPMPLMPEPPAPGVLPSPRTSLQRLSMVRAAGDVHNDIAERHSLGELLDNRISPGIVEA